MKLELVAAGAAPLETEAVSGEVLSRAIWLSGKVRPLPLCSGLGRCGRCRVRWLQPADAVLSESTPIPPPAPLPAEEAVFSQEELAAGWRLACRHTVPAGAGLLRLEMPAENFLPPVAVSAALPEMQTVSADILGNVSGDCVSSRPNIALAVDLGTTSLYWQAVDTASGQEVAGGHFLNPQAGAGADVISRLAVARKAEGLSRLAQLVRTSLAGLCRATGAGFICLAANPAMTAIFLEEDVEGLCAAPYRLPCKGHETYHLPGLPPLYLPPLPAPFVGGDISAGLAALLAADTPRPFVLADLGTNGELALVDASGQCFLTSVPLGPALEGIGPACGQLAGPDVLTRFSLGAQGLVGHSPDGSDAPARGISATGYLSLLAILRQTGLLDSSGLFLSSEAVAATAIPLSRKIGRHFRTGHGQPCLDLPRGQWLSGADVEELLKVKAAFALALDTLLAEAQLSPRDVACLCLGGALGEHLQPGVLEELGFVPPGLGRRIRAVGNSSLAGAALLARDTAWRERLAALCAEARLLPLVDKPDFHSAYMRHMRFGF